MLQIKTEHIDCCESIIGCDINNSSVSIKRQAFDDTKSKEEDNSNKYLIEHKYIASDSKICDDQTKFTFIVSENLKYIYPTWFSSKVVCEPLNNVKPNHVYYSCQNCNFITPNKGIMEFHNKKHLEENMSLKYDQLKSNLRSKKLITYSKQASKMALRPLSRKSLTKKNLHCKHCARIFTTDRLLNKHRKNTRGNIE